VPPCAIASGINLGSFESTCKLRPAHPGPSSKSCGVYQSRFIIRRAPLSSSSAPRGPPMTRSPLLRAGFALTLCLVPAPRSRLATATGVIKEYPLPSEAGDPHTPLFHQGKVWFTAQGANRYGVLDPASGSAKIYPVPTPHSRPYGLVAAPDGMIWMALFGTNQIGRINPADGSLRIFPLPAPASRPRRLIVDGHGIVWYSDYARGKLGRLDPATGQVRDFPSPGGDGSEPYGIAVGTDGRIWYDESGTD